MTTASTTSHDPCAWPSHRRRPDRGYFAGTAGEVGLQPQQPPFLDRIGHLCSDQGDTRQPRCLLQSRHDTARDAPHALSLPAQPTMPDAGSCPHGKPVTGQQCRHEGSCQRRSGACHRPRLRHHRRSPTRFDGRHCQVVTEELGSGSGASAYKAGESALASPLANCTNAPIHRFEALDLEYFFFRLHPARRQRRGGLGRTGCKRFSNRAAL